MELFGSPQRLGGHREEFSFLTDRETSVKCARPTRLSESDGGQASL
ncbi:hypothetical protein LCGC14_1607880 [marine sediment metagenome]|uniref:Uncharacterized protein n=1 Tax=marine sediment metagenome TaxID=412755 RepID=A0A0F9I970_9ZZZZ